jgi:hypothetical protein
MNSLLGKGCEDSGLTRLAEEDWGAGVVRRAGGAEPVRRHAPRKLEPAPVVFGGTA